MARNRDYFRALKDLLLERAEHRCEYCGDVLGAGESSIDHVDPEGPDEVGNYRIACRSCNSAKGQKSLEEFRHYRLTLLIRESMPALGFSTAQVAWLNEQDWFPFRVSEAVRFHFETRRQ